MKEYNHYKWCLEQEDKQIAEKNAVFDQEVLNKAKLLKDEA